MSNSDDDGKITTKTLDQVTVLPDLSFDSGVDLLEKNKGFIIGARGPVPLRKETEAHLITIGMTGAGKGVATAIPNLLDHPGSVFSLEIGGNTIKETYNYRKNVLGQDVYVFDPMGVTGLPNSSYNPLDDLDPDSDAFMSDVSTLVRNLTMTSDGTKDSQAYFQEISSDFLKAMITYVKFADESQVPPENRNLVYINSLFSKYPNEEWQDLMLEFKNYQGPYQQLINKCGNYQSSGDPNSENLRSIVSATGLWLNFASDDKMARYLTKSDFSMRDLRNKKVTIYVVMPEISHFISNHSWLRCLVTSGLNFVPNYGDGGANFQHEDRILFMIDEMTHLGKLEAVLTAQQTARQKGIALWSMFQDVSNFKKVYGEEATNSFLSGAEVLQVYNTSDTATTDYIAKRTGRRLVFIPSLTEGTNESTSDTTSVSRTTSHGEQLSESIADSLSRSTSNSRAVTDGTSRAKSVSDTKTVGKTITVGVTETFGTSTSRGSSSGPNGGSSSFSSGRSHSIANSFSVGDSVSNAHTKGTTDTTSYSVSVTKGETDQVGVTKTKGLTTSTQTSDQDGTSKAVSTGRTYSVTYQPQIIPSLDMPEIMRLISEDSQMLFIYDKKSSRQILDFRARFYNIPMLARRANGPQVPQLEFGKNRRDYPNAPALLLPSIRFQSPLAAFHLPCTVQETGRGVARALVQRADINPVYVDKVRKYQRLDKAWEQLLNTTVAVGTDTFSKLYDFIGEPESLTTMALKAVYGLGAIAVATTVATTFGTLGTVWVGADQLINLREKRRLRTAIIRPTANLANTYLAELASLETLADRLADADKTLDNKNQRLNQIADHHESMIELNHQLAGMVEEYADYVVSIHDNPEGMKDRTKQFLAFADNYHALREKWFDLKKLSYLPPMQKPDLGISEGFSAAANEVVDRAKLTERTSSHIIDPVSKVTTTPQITPELEKAVKHLTEARADVAKILKEPGLIEAYREFVAAIRPSLHTVRSDDTSEASNQNDQPTGRSIDSNVVERIHSALTKILGKLPYIAQEYDHMPSQQFLESVTIIGNQFKAVQDRSTQLEQYADRLMQQEEAISKGRADLLARLDTIERARQIMLKPARDIVAANPIWDKIDHQTKRLSLAPPPAVPRIARRPNAVLDGNTGASDAFDIM